MNAARIGIIIPTLNEAESIELVLRELPRELLPAVVVVDSGSRDGTQAIARACGARVIDEPRRGYGRACLTGLEAIGAAEIAVFLDGDYSDRPSELHQLLAPLQRDAADLVLGSRLTPGHPTGALATGALPWHSRTGNRFAAAVLRRACGLHLTDLGPFRAARVPMLRALELGDERFGWAVEMLIKAHLRGYRVLEIPVSYYPRLGHSKITGTVRGSLGAAAGILGGIVKYRWREHAGEPAQR